MLNLENGEHQPTPPADNSAEIEKKPPKYASRLVSKWPGRLSQDALLVYSKPEANNEVFGAFDGMSGMPGRPEIAAQAAANAVALYLQQWDGKDCEPSEMTGWLKHAYDLARSAVAVDGAHGSTTGTTVWIKEFEGNKFAAIGHAGDCGAYIIRGGDIIWLTEKQGGGSNVTNFFSGTPGNDHRMSQTDVFSLFEIQPGDRLVVCTDGITGSGTKNFLDDSELLAASQGNTIEQTVGNLLVASSQVHDDKAVVVVDAFLTKTK